MHRNTRPKKWGMAFILVTSHYTTKAHWMHIEYSSISTKFINALCYRKSYTFLPLQFTCFARCENVRKCASCIPVPIPGASSTCIGKHREKQKTRKLMETQKLKENRGNVKNSEGKLILSERGGECISSAEIGGGNLKQRECIIGFGGWTPLPTIPLIPMFS